MFLRKKKEDPRAYKVTNIGNLIIECVQSPHSYQNEKGKVWEILSYDMRLRVDDGPIFFERHYACGTKEAREKVSRFLIPMDEAADETDAKWQFYAALSKKWNDL